MLWNQSITYLRDPFELERDLEDGVLEVADQLFGEDRFYLDTKRKITRRGGKSNIPDGYLIDLTSKKEPRLYVVENELARHEPLKHIAVQILEFSLAFETSPQRVKEVVKSAMKADTVVFSRCEKYATDNGFENVDVLLEKMIYGPRKFFALVIIDEVSEDLEQALVSRFQFPVEIVTLQRYSTGRGKRIFEFEPFLSDVEPTPGDASSKKRGSKKRLDPAEVDTIVVPARDGGFKEVFIGENRWYKIRIHPSWIPRIHHIAVYRVAPTSAITHIADVASIVPWPNSNKYVVHFKAPAKKLRRHIRLVPKSTVKAPQGPRYTSISKLKAAKTLDDAFDN